MRDEITILSDYIRQESGYAGALDPEVDLIDGNILDSFSIVQLVVFIQEQFGVELEPEDFARAHLATLAGIVALIDRRKDPARG